MIWAGQDPVCGYQDEKPEAFDIMSILGTYVTTTLSDDCT
jgi:hypothetical protein